MKNPHGKSIMITGNMFGGKTERLLEMTGRLVHAGHTIGFYKPKLDDRRGTETINSHNSLAVPCIAVESPGEILQHVAKLPDVTIVAFDEAQFWDDSIITVVEKLRWEEGKIVIGAGLKLDFRGVGFGPMPTLIQNADDIIVCNAYCQVCAELGTERVASHTQRLVNGKPAHYDDPVIQVGADESYRAVCSAHWCVPGHPTNKVVATRKFLLTV